MSLRTIMIFPEFENMDIIDRIRDKYDPLARLVRPHITLVFPFENEMSNETIEEIALRELKEECGITAEKLELLDVLSGKEYYFEYPNGDKMCTVIVLFKVTNYSGTLKISDNESQLLQFFPLTNLPAMEKRAEMIVQRILNKTIIV